MRLKSLRLKGFKGFRSGIGLDEVFIDFNDLPDGLIAITGNNGMGKTTLIDNMHPYRLMPYKLRKAKEWSPNAFSYYDHCYGNASKELVFEINGNEYRSLLLIDVDKNKQEAYLHVKEDGEWIPLNDGKTKTYDAKVEEMVGSPRLFFTSVFRSQGAKKLSEYSRSDIIKIISELLNIDHIKKQGDKAKTVVDAIKRIRDEASTRVSLLESELSEYDKLEIVLKKKSLEIVKTNELLSESKSLLESKTNEIAELEKKKIIQESVNNRLKDLEKAHSQDQNELRVLVSESKKVNDDTTIKQNEVLKWYKNEVTDTETEISSSTTL